MTNLLPSSQNSPLQDPTIDLYKETSIPIYLDPFSKTQIYPLTSPETRSTCTKYTEMQINFFDRFPPNHQGSTHHGHPRFHHRTKKSKSKEREMEREKERETITFNYEISNAPTSSVKHHPRIQIRRDAAEGRPNFLDIFCAQVGIRGPVELRLNRGIESKSRRDGSERRP